MLDIGECKMASAGGSFDEKSETVTKEELTITVPPSVRKIECPEPQCQDKIEMICDNLGTTHR